MQARRRRGQVDNELGHRIRLRRIQLRMSQTELGKALGVTFQQVQKYENGKNRISAGRLKVLAETLEVPIPFFFEPLKGVTNQNQAVFKFLDSAYTLRLLQAFSKIKDRNAQRKILELIEKLAANK